MDEKRLRVILAAHQVEVWEDYVVNVYSVKNEVGDCVKGEEFFPLFCFRPEYPVKAGVSGCGAGAKRVDLHAWLGY